MNRPAVMSQSQKISRHGATIATFRDQDSGVAIVAPLRETFFQLLDGPSTHAMSTHEPTNPSPPLQPTRQTTPRG